MAVAQRIYANALFEAAKERGNLDTVRQELEEFLSAMEQVPELRALLENPEIDTNERVAALRADPRRRRRARPQLPAPHHEKGRTHELPVIAQEFETLVAREEGILDVELTTAVELSDDAARQILERIEGVSDRKLRATRRVDPNLIGGFVLQAGSHRVDASVRSRLDTLRRQLTGTGRS